MHRSCAASNSLFPPFPRSFYTSPKSPYLFLNSTSVHKLTCSPASLNYPCFSYSNHNLVSHSQLPSPPHISSSVHFLCNKSFYLLNQNPPTYRVPIILPCILTSAPMFPSMKSFGLCPSLEEKVLVRFYCCTEHCQALNRLERRVMLVRCSQGTLHINRVPNNLVKIQATLYSVTDVILPYGKQMLFYAFYSRALF